MKPSDAISAIKYTAYELRLGVFLWGPPGIGKSDMIYQIAQELGIGVVDKRLSQSDPTELKGYPWPDQKKKVMTFFRDEELPTEGAGILFLDEMNSAPQATQAAAYQLILNRRLGTYELPPDWIVVAAGNRSTDRSVVHAQPAALSNRFVHIDLVPDVEDWVDWAEKNGVSDATRGYMRYRPSNLFTDKIEVGMRSFPTPRSWVFADKIISSNPLRPEVAVELIKGTVGEGVALEYVGYVRDAKNLANPDRVLLDPEGTKVPTSPSECYAMISALEPRTTPSNIGQVFKYVKRMPKEFEVVFMQSMARRGDDYGETETMTTWIRENRSILV